MNVFEWNIQKLFNLWFESYVIHFLSLHLFYPTINHFKQWILLTNFHQFWNEVGVTTPCSLPDSLLILGLPNRAILKNTFKEEIGRQLNCSAFQIMFQWSMKYELKNIIWQHLLLKRKNRWYLPYHLSQLKYQYSQLKITKKTSTYDLLRIIN